MYRKMTIYGHFFLCNLYIFVWIWDHLVNIVFDLDPSNRVIKSLWYTVNVLNFVHQIFYLNGGKQCRLRSDSSWKSSLIRVCAVCHSTKYFKKQLHEKQNAGKKSIEWSVQNFRTSSILCFVFRLTLPGNIIEDEREKAHYDASLGEYRN